MKKLMLLSLLNTIFITNCYTSRKSYTSDPLREKLDALRSERKGIETESYNLFQESLDHGCPKNSHYTLIQGIFYRSWVNTCKDIDERYKRLVEQDAICIKQINALNKK